MCAGGVKFKSGGCENDRLLALRRTAGQYPATMQPSRFLGRIIFALALAGLAAVGGGFWWLATQGDATAFLPAHAGAEWITAGRLPENKTRFAFPTVVAFQKTFVLADVPTAATLSVRAFRIAQVAVNGQEVGELRGDGRHWKAAATANISSRLHAGTNELVVTVTNNLAPPALWLRLVAGTFAVGSDETWGVSPGAGAGDKAHDAARPVSLPAWTQLHDDRSTWDSVRRSWRRLLVYTAGALVLIFAAGRWWRSGERAGRNPAASLQLLFVIVIALRAALFLNDQGGLSPATGFDAKQHGDYIKFIQQKHALPLPNDGWEMHQPPLYYLVAAAVLAGGGLTVDQRAAVVPLHAVNGVLGLLHCWLAWLCLRRLFPGNYQAQAVGLLVAAFLPAHLYLSMYVTNDPLAGVLVTAAFYFFLRVLRSETEDVRLYAAIGLTLGAAMLAKLSAVIAVPCFLMALGIRLVGRGDCSPRSWWRSVGVVGLLCFATCGWHYGRVWMQIGAIPLPNSQTNPASAWWQDPGFHTAGYYLHFGRALVAPLFSGLDSFPDGIYSTLWGDGLISGNSSLVFRPPWNYDLMYAGCLLGLPLTLLAAGGLFICIGRFLRQPKPELFLMPAMLCAYVLGIVYLTLHSPWLASVKAFYALPALVPFCALVAIAWSWLAQKNRVLRILLWLLVLVWAFTAGATYWISWNNPETWRNLAIGQVQQQQFEQASGSISNALRLNPNDPESHHILAVSLEGQNKPAEAIQEYEAAMRLQPDSPGTLNDFAKLLIRGEKNDAEKAVKLAQQACQLTGYGRVEMITTLALAQANSGQVDEAIATTKQACEVAARNGETVTLGKNQELLEFLEHQNAQPANKTP